MRVAARDLAARSSTWDGHQGLPGDRPGGAAQQWPVGAGHTVPGCGPSVCAWSEAAIDECGEAVEQALQPELEQVLQIEIVIGSGEAFEDGEAARLHD